MLSSWFLVYSECVTLRYLSVHSWCFRLSSVQLFHVSQHSVVAFLMLWSTPFSFFSLIISKLMDWSGVIPAYVCQRFWLLTAVYVIGEGATVPFSSKTAFGLARLLESRLILYLLTYLWITFTDILGFESAEQECRNWLLRRCLNVSKMFLAL